LGPGAAVELAATGLARGAADLFEEQRNPEGGTAVTDVAAGG